MFFECRVNVPECSPLFAEAKEAFLKGEVLRARELTLDLQKQGRWNIPEDALLCGDLSRACGDHLQFCATMKMAFKKWPESRRVKVGYAVAQSGRFYTLQALALLEELFADSPDHEKALLASEFAATYARGRFQTSAAAWIEKTQSFDHGDDPKVFYNLAFAASSNRDWEKSLLFGNQALRLAPFWLHVRRLVADALLANGELQAANQLLADGRQTAYRDAGYEYFLAVQSFTTGHMEATSRLIRQFQNDWPFAKDFIKPSRVLLAFALWNCGKLEEAREVALASEIQKTVELFASVSATAGNRKIIPTPLISQESYLCVPTSVMMVAAAQEVELNPRELFVRMLGRDGTQLWRMAEEMQRREFQVHFVNATHDAIRGMIDQGIPLIGELEDVMNGHVEVICGYDDDLKVYYVRDPAHWSIGMFSFADLEPRYAMSCHSLIALVSPAKQKTVQLKPEWLSQAGELLNRFAAACIQGKVAEAEYLKSALPEDGVAAFKCASWGKGITHRLTEHRQTIERFSHNTQAPIVGRIQGLLQLATPNRIDELLELVKQQHEQLGWWIVEYFKLLSCSHKGQWQEVLALSDKLLARHCAFDVLWTHRATAFLELGKPELAQKMLATALDISPQSREIQDRIRSITRIIVPFDEKEKELLRAMQDFPDYHPLKEDYAILLLESDRGLAYEKWELEYQKYFPKMPQSYQRLATWYVNQGRPGRARKVLENGRQIIGLEELPYLEFEEKTAAGAAVDAAAAEDNAALLKAAERAIFSEKFENPDELQSVQKLQARHHEGKLSWYEYNQLLAIRLHGVLQAQQFANNFKVKESIAAMLPEQLPGTPLLTLDYFLDQCHWNQFPRLAMTAVLEWSRRICEGQALSPNLQFSLGFLKECCNDLKEAENDFKNLQENFPSYYAPQYRLGEILFQRGDWEEAIKAHQAAVSLRPGLPGSWERLTEIHFRMSKIDAAVSCLKKLCQCSPYSFEALDRLLDVILRHHGWQEARNELEAASQQHHEAEACRVFLARILLDGGELEQAQAIAGLPLEIPELARYHCITQLNLALALQKYTDADEIIQAALEKWPQDSYFHQQKAKRLAQKEAEGTVAYLESLFSQGIADPILAQMYLEMLRQEKLQNVINVITAAKASHKIHLAETFAHCFREPPYVALKMEFLSWLNKNLPHLYHLREEFVEELWLLERHYEAREVAASLHKQDPENPAWLALLAKCLEAYDPQQALQHLTQAYAYTGSVDHLTQMASCYLKLGEKTTACSHYWQALERNPYEVSALVNLFLFGDKKEKLMHLFFSAVQKGYGVYMQMFHLAALEIARYFETTVPPNWGGWAMRRLEIIKHQRSGYSDEEERLGKAIFVWLRRQGKKQEAKAYTPPLWARLKLLNWPGTTWVPPEK